MRIRTEKEIRTTRRIVASTFERIVSNGKSAVNFEQ
jgi:hypothetical protein